MSVTAVRAQRFNSVQRVHNFLHSRSKPPCKVWSPYAGWPSVAARTRRGTRRPGDSRKIGICAVTGQVVSSCPRLGLVRSRASDPSSRMKSGT